MFRKILAVALPLVSVVPITTPAQTTQYGDWQTDLTSSEVPEAFTVNLSGSIFGFICSVSIDRCVYYVSANTTCNQGSKSSILINTEAGALTSDIICTQLGNNYYNVIQDTQDLSNAMLKSTNIGIAIPMESGEFKVVRFSLMGSNAATGVVAARAVELQKYRDHMQ